MGLTTEPVALLRPSEHLVALVERASVAAGRVAAASPAERTAHRARAIREQARYSARLDASPLTDETAALVDGHAAPQRLPRDEPAAATDAGWAAALRLDGVPTQDIAAQEYANVIAARRLSDDLVDSVLDAPLDAMQRLHTAICSGLVADDRVATLRRTDRAVHDGAQGRMLWACPPPARLPSLVDALLDWLAGPAATRAALVVGAVVHERLLEWQPFEAANGRLAREMARLVVRARGVDVDGLSVPEQIWSRDVMAYHREVAATMRRRGDLTRWTERSVHAQAIALERLADVLRPSSVPAPPGRAAEYLDGLAVGTPVTAREYADRTGTSPSRARADLDAARRAGLVVDDVAVVGRRYRVAG